MFFCPTPVHCWLPCTKLVIYTDIKMISNTKFLQFVKKKANSDSHTPQLEIYLMQSSILFSSFSYSHDPVLFSPVNYLTNIYAALWYSAPDSYSWSQTSVGLIRKIKSTKRWYIADKKEPPHQSQSQWMQTGNSECCGEWVSQTNELPQKFFSTLKFQQSTAELQG